MFLSGSLFSLTPTIKMMSQKHNNIHLQYEGCSLTRVVCLLLEVEVVNKLSFKCLFKMRRHGYILTMTIIKVLLDRNLC